jgi:hypothetical protein
MHYNTTPRNSREFFRFISSNNLICSSLLSNLARFFTRLSVIDPFVRLGDNAKTALWISGARVGESVPVLKWTPLPSRAASHRKPFHSITAPTNLSVLHPIV